jgi:cellulose biosynthesis protein BcsQ
MYIVTFYSYKGGVGRTMALVNAGIDLARRGRKVLIVDFDLEAPGISTYKCFGKLDDFPGIVEYVSAFRDTGNAPIAADYIAECTVGNSSIWIMPAGRRNADYSDRLASIDWQLLYTVQSGYLMFEDLKQQWQAVPGPFDYVLIDSRTGHTDVGGICTRHLPDAVVLMFFPNEQNLIGLETIASEIRREVSGIPEHKIVLHFCASNVPDLDDEEHILERKLDEARNRLCYVQDPILIHHYNSLSLIDQSIFVEDRPSSKLAKEYIELTNAIVTKNLEDAEGALAVLNSLRDELRGIRQHSRRSKYSSADETLEKITKLHPKNGEIAWAMAAIYNLLGDLEHEYERLTVAINQNISTIAARRRRAAIAILQGRKEDALSDLKSVIESRETEGFELVGAAELLQQLDENLVTILQNSPAWARLELKQRLRMAEMLLTGREGAKLAARLLSGSVSTARDSPDGENVQNEYVLALIGSQQFDAALRSISNNREELLASDKLPLIFNYAMAEWGKTGEAPQGLMAHAIELGQRDNIRDVNRYQCFALAQFVCGNKEQALNNLEQAREELVRASAPRYFSCWSYRKISRHTMERELDMLRQFIEGRGDGPAIFIENDPVELDRSFEKSSS